MQENNIYVIIFFMSLAVSNKTFNLNYLGVNSALDSFDSFLAGKKYQEAAKIVGDLLTESSLMPILRNRAIDHFNSMSAPTPESSCLVDILVSADVQDGSYGFHVNWMNVNTAWFRTILGTYKQALTSKGLDSQQKLSSDLAEYFTYRAFSREHAEIFIAEIPSFDPYRPCNMYTTTTYLEMAERCRLSSDLIQYLKSLSPAPNLEKVAFETVDYTEFRGIDELKAKTFEPVIITKGELAVLASPLKIYHFLGRPNPAFEGDKQFFRNEVRGLVERYHQSLQQAVENTQKVYHNSLKAYEGIISLQSEGIECLGTQELSLDSTISRGRKTIGLTTFKGKQIVCKFISQIFKFDAFGFTAIQQLGDFVQKCRKLRAAVPNVVKVQPCVVLNRAENGDIDVGYLMKVQPGKTLGQISHLSTDEKQEIQRQFDQSVRSMLEAGYALYDFHEDNVIWDGKKLTFIDLSAAGFKEEALRHADTRDVIYRMSRILWRR